MIVGDVRSEILELSIDSVTPSPSLSTEEKKLKSNLSHELPRRLLTNTRNSPPTLLKGPPRGIMRLLLMMSNGRGIFVDLIKEEFVFLVFCLEDVCFVVLVCLCTHDITSIVEGRMWERAGEHYYHL